MSDFEIYDEIKELKAKIKRLEAINAQLAAELQAAELKAKHDAETISDLCDVCMHREKQISELKSYIESGVKI